MVFKKCIIRLVLYKVILEDDKQQMIRIAICDDEKRFCLKLEKYILKYEFINDIEIEIKKFYTGEDLIEFIKKEEIDLLFLDIELVKMNGIRVGEYIRDTLENYGCIIFSVGERKFSPNAKFFCKKNRNTHQISCII